MWDLWTCPEHQPTGWVGVMLTAREGWTRWDRNEPTGQVESIYLCAKKEEEQSAFFVFDVVQHPVPNMELGDRHRETLGHGLPITSWSWGSKCQKLRKKWGSKSAISPQQISLIRVSLRGLYLSPPLIPLLFDEYGVLSASSFWGDRQKKTAY